MKDKLYYTIKGKITAKQLINILSHYIDSDIYVDNEQGIIIEYDNINNNISLEGMSYFYYVDSFETLDDYKNTFDNSLIYSDITAGHLIEILSNNENMTISVIGNDYFTITIHDNEIIFDCIFCANCFENSIKELSEEHLSIYQI